MLLACPPCLWPGHLDSLCPFPIAAKNAWATSSALSWEWGVCKTLLLQNFTLWLVPPTQPSATSRPLPRPRPARTPQKPLQKENHYPLKARSALHASPFCASHLGSPPAPTIGLLLNVFCLIFHSYCVTSSRKPPFLYPGHDRWCLPGALL